MKIQKPEGVQTIYEEICRSHDGIADFRAKLLALLPLASGTGIYLLLDTDKEFDASNFIPIGLFGVLITIGLFIYELRGIQRCISLSKCGGLLEAELLGVDAKIGTFKAEPDAAYGFVGNTWAALLIYNAIIGAWVFVAASGFQFIEPTEKLAIAGVIVLSGIIGGLLVLRKQTQILKKQLETLKSASTISE